MADFVKLNNGVFMPMLGLGTGSDGSLSYQDRKSAISSALQIGYRHFDTASSYNSEEFLGEALADALAAGLVKRQDLFVTSKLSSFDTYPEGVLPALQKSLSQLQLEYLDLYLIHAPIRFKQRVTYDTAYVPTADDLLPFDLKGTWKAMENCAKEGLTKAIGVSNFSSKKIGDLLDVAEIPPAVNQVEMHPKWQQRKLRETCSKANIHVCAWSPLGAPLMKWGTVAVLDDPIIKDIALKHAKTPAQVVLRWGLDQGVTVLPKSFNKTRMTENFQIFGWQLTKEDHENISKIEQKKNMDLQCFCDPVNGQYKTVADLWDGEI